MSEQRDSKAELLENLGPILPVRLDVAYPERLSRLLLFVKWLLVIPLYVALVFYGIATAVVGFIAFWAIVFTGRFPKGMFDFVEGYLAFAFKTTSYFPLLITDEWTPGDYHPVDFRIEYPERLSRLVLLFVKLPSYLLGIAPALVSVSIVVLLIAVTPTWFIMLVSGKYQKPLFALALAFSSGPPELVRGNCSCVTISPSSVLPVPSRYRSLSAPLLCFT